MKKIRSLPPSRQRTGKRYSLEKYLSEAYFNKDLTDEAGAMEKLQYFKKFEGFCDGILPVFFVLDYVRQQYLLHAGTSYLLPGYHPRDFLDGGMDLLRYIINKDDFRIYGEEIFSRNSAFLESAPRQEHENYIFSHTFRAKTRHHQQVHILQKGSYITSPETGLPLYSFGICLNVSSLKQDSIIVHTIEKKTAEQPGILQTITNNYFFPDQEDARLTPREKEVLSYMTDGLVIKEIADKMKLSETTVITHRKNAMIKTNTKNSAELVAHCIRKRII